MISTKRAPKPERRLPDFREYKISPRHQAEARRAGLENIPLVVTIAQKYSEVAKKLGVSQNEIIQAGVFGLIEAKRNFREELGNEFSTFASPYIRGYILNYLKELKPYGGTAKYSFLLSKALDLWGRKSRGEDISKSLKSSSELVKKIFDSINSEDRADILKERLRTRRTLEDHANFPEALDKQISDGRVLHEVVPDERKSALDILDSEQTKRKLMKRFMELNPRERYVIELRLLTEEPKTLEEVGQLLGLTRERIRQIEAIALKKLKSKLLQEE